MSGHFPPLTCDDVKRILREMGFTQQKSKSGSSHAQWVKDVGGKRHKVTVDCPKAPFTQFLIDSMARQAGSSKREFYRIYENIKRGAFRESDTASGPDGV